MLAPALLKRDRSAHVSRRLRRPAVMGLLAFVLANSLASVATADTVYKCAKPDGSVEFSAKPCGADAKAVDVDGRSPYDRQRDAERVWHVIGAADSVMAKTCLDAYWRPLLKDPESAKLIDGEAITVGSKERTLVVAEGRARNGFGGMNVQYFVCDVDHAGAVYPANVHGDLRSIAERIEKYGIEFALPGTGK